MIAASIGTEIMTREIERDQIHVTLSRAGLVKFTTSEASWRMIWASKGRDTIEMKNV